MSKRKNRTFTAEFKVEAVSLVIDKGYTQVEAARNLGVEPSLLGKWVRASKQASDAKDAFPGHGNINKADAEVMSLKKQLNKVSRERDILKKALGYFANHPE